MYFADSTSLSLDHPSTPVPRVGVAQRLVGAILERGRRRRELLEWNRNLPRPFGCRHLPDRVWQRHSALLSLRATGTLR